MDYYLLTDLAAQVGHGLAISGAETFRVEDTIRRILLAYGIECEVFAIPNCLTISFEAANGKPLKSARDLANAAKEDQVLLLVQRDGGRIFIPIRTKTK